MSFSDDARVNFNRLNADEALLACLEISHNLLSETIRLVNDNKNLVSNGSEYVAFPFSVVPQDDIQGELPKVSLSVPNIGRELVRWIDSSGGAKGATIKVVLIRRSAPDLIEESLDFGINTVTINSQNVVFSLIVQNNLTKRSCRLVYNTKKAPGLFI